jgi:PAS domain S-box-containing protein
MRRPDGPRNLDTVAVDERGKRDESIERLFRGLFEGVPTAVTLRDMDTQRLIDCNDAAWKLYGCASREEMFATKPLDLSAETQPDGVASPVAFRASVERAISNGTVRLEWLARRKNGQQFLADIRISIVQVEGVRIMQALIDDIGERRAAEERLSVRAERDAILGRVARSFVEGDSDRAVQAAVEAVARSLRVHRGRVRRLVDGDSAVLTTHKWRAGPHVPELRDRDALTPEGVVWFRAVMRDGARLSDPRPVSAYVDNASTETGGSLLALPLMVEGAVSGWLAFEDVERTRIWTEAELGFAERAAEVIALGRARAEAEASLRGSEERYRMLIEHMPDAVFLIDGAQRVLFASKGVTSIFGYTPEEWMVTPGLARRIASEGTLDRIVAQERALATGVGLPDGVVRHAWRRKDGRIVHTEARVAAIHADGVFKGTQIIHRDVSDRHNEEQAGLRRARLDEMLSAVSRGFLGLEPERAIDSALEHLGVLLQAERVCVFEPDDAGERLVCSRRWYAQGVEPGWESLDAYPLPAGVFTPVTHLPRAPADGDGDDDDRSANQWVSVLQRDSGRRMLYAQIGYGRRVFGLLSVRLREGEAPPDVASAVRAVGELLAIGRVRHAAAVELAKAKEDAVSASQSKSAFLANMSHELRTPLNGVIGMVDLLSGTPLAPRQKRYVEVARSSAKLLLSVINDVLDFSKIEAGKLELESIPFAIADIVAEVVSVLALSADAKGLRLGNELGPDAGVRLLGDPARLLQVLVNLVGNAIKFTERGEVVIRAALEEQSPGLVGLRVEVVDTGIGVPRDTQARLFRPFAQADASTTRQHGGTGLGLAICRELVERMSGRIDLTSDGHSGSTFWFTLVLPRAPEESEEHTGEGPGPPSSRRHEPRATSSAHILLVEDSRVNVEVATTILGNAGHTFVVVGDGLAAVEAVKREAFDLVLMDCQLPGIDGYEATRRVRALEASGSLGDLARLPIIALTASATKGDFDRSIEAGMDGHISKPVDAGRLLAEIAEKLRAQGPPPPPSSGQALAPPRDAPRVADLGRALSRIQGNRELLARLRVQFAQSAVELRAKLRTAVELRDAKAASFAVHRLRGQAATFEAEALLARITPFEQAVARASFVTAAAALHAIELELDRLLAVLASE